MNKLYFICDESGSKGFADNEEKFEGEFGVFAGYFLTESNYENLKTKFEIIYQKYVITGQKLHITDLTPEKQENLRKDVFECLQNENISCAYEAISVKGFNREFKHITDIKKKQVKELEQKLSFSKNVEKDRLHSVLFQGLFGKAIAYYIDKKIGNKICIEIITDNIDNSLKREFEVKAKELINPLETPIQINAFDKEKKQPIAKTITLSSEQLNDDISITQFNIVVEDNALTLIADILANTVSHYLNKAVAKNPNVILNSKDGIEEHPLLTSFYGLSTDTVYNVVSDKIYGRADFE